MKTFRLGVILFAVSFSLQAQNNPQETVDEAYRLMVSQAIKGEAIDFTHLRLIYTKTSYFQPYGDIRIAFNDILQRNQWQTAKEQINQLIWLGNFSLVDFSHIAVNVFTALNENNSRAFFQYSGEQLLNSIYRSGDGLTEETAWQAVNIREPYFLLNSLNYRVVNAETYTKAGKTFEKLLAEELASGLQASFFFDITLMQVASPTLNN